MWLLSAPSVDCASPPICERRDRKWEGVGAEEFRRRRGKEGEEEEEEEEEEAARATATPLLSTTATSTDLDLEDMERSAEVGEEEVVEDLAPLGLRVVGKEDGCREEGEG
jgi:hypothetical protein